MGDDNYYPRLIESMRQDWAQAFPEFIKTLTPDRFPDPCFYSREYYVYELKRLEDLYVGYIMLSKYWRTIYELTEEQLQEQLAKAARSIDHAEEELRTIDAWLEMEAGRALDKKRKALDDRDARAKFLSAPLYSSGSTGEQLPLF